MGLDNSLAEINLHDGRGLDEGLLPLLCMGEDESRQVVTRLEFVIGRSDDASHDCPMLNCHYGLQHISGISFRSCEL